MQYQLNDFEPKLFTGSMSVDYDTVVSRAEEALEHPADSAWSDEELWVTHTLMFSTPDITLTDDDLPGWSNYRSILKALKDAYPDDVEDASFGHWTFSKFCAVKVRVIDADGFITPAFAEAVEIAYDLEHNNFLFDEQDFMELETEISDAYLKQFAEEHKLNYATMRDVMDNNNIYYNSWTGGGWDGLDDEETLVTLTREAMSTWLAHYYGSDGHYPDQCFYCERAKVVA